MPKLTPTLEAGDHLLFIDRQFNMRTSNPSDPELDKRARIAFKENPAAEILHVVIAAKYSANPQPVITTLAEKRLTE